MESRLLPSCRFFFVIPCLTSSPSVVDAKESSRDFIARQAAAGFEQPTGQAFDQRHAQRPFAFDSLNVASDVLAISGWHRQQPVPDRLFAWRQNVARMTFVLAVNFAGVIASLRYAPELVQSTCLRAANLAGAHGWATGPRGMMFLPRQELRKLIRSSS
jgi:hypothetical protein